jgi:hypothetical protein
MLRRHGHLRTISVRRRKVQLRHHHQKQVPENLQQRDGGKRKRGRELVGPVIDVRSESIFTLQVVAKHISIAMTFSPNNMQVTQTDRA